jgi:HTH-type transcriptional regulator / antitoxin HigA
MEMREMGVIALDHAEYGRLCAEVLPKIIESDPEFDYFVDRLEELKLKLNPSPEERALATLLAKLIRDYNDVHYPLSKASPREMVLLLLRERGLKQSDLVEVIGSQTQVSNLVRGKRAISKEQVKRLAAFFKVSTDLFL